MSFHNSLTLATFAADTRKQYCYLQGVSAMATASHYFSSSIQCGLFIIDIPNIKYASGNLLIMLLS